jgi:hypothetical protein
MYCCKGDESNHRLLFKRRKYELACSSLKGENREGGDVALVETEPRVGCRYY